MEELNNDSVLRESLAEELKGACDLERLMSRVSCGSASPKELVVLKSTLAEAAQAARDPGKCRISLPGRAQGQLGPWKRSSPSWKDR